MAIGAGAKIIECKQKVKSKGEVLKYTFNKLKKAVDKFLDLDVTYLGAISDDRKLVKSVRDQVPFVIAYPNSDAAREIDIIAEKFINGKEYNAKPSIGAKGVFRKLFDLFS